MFVFHTKDGERYGLFGLGCKVQSLGIGSRIFDVMGKEVHDHEQEENTGKGHEDEINISSIEEEGEGKHGVNTYAIGTSPTGEQEVNKVEENAERIQVLDDRKGEAEPSVIGTSTGEQEEQNKVKKTRKEYKYSTILGRENLVPC